MARNTLNRDDIHQEIISLIKTEVNEWQDATAFVTEDIAFQMRDMIRTLRKNYFGIFDKPYDSTTGRKKVWVPLTETTVDSVRKNIDIDTKDINLRAKRHAAIGLTEFVRNLVRIRLDQMYFGEKLDRLITNTSIDGTGIWKTFLTSYGNKKAVDVRLVDPLNLYIDPVAEDIQSTTIIERAVLTPSELKSMDGWENTDLAVFDERVSPNDRDLEGTGGNALVSVYERWGIMPKSYITGKKKDEDELIEGHIVVSGLEKGGRPVVHLVEENTNKDSDGSIVKPYEEMWYSRVPGRWYGRGPAEKVMFLQVWLNTIANIRINRSYVSQLGIFKVRKGSGITPQMLSGLASNGVVVMNQMDDLQQMPIQEASQASYNDEQVIKDWAKMVTSTFEGATGEALPSSTPATNAVLAQRASQSQFFLVKEQIGMFLQRWMKRHFLPMLPKTISKNDVERLTGEDMDMKKFDEGIVNKMLMNKLQELQKQGKFADPAAIAREKRRLLSKLKAQGKDRFVKLMEKVDLSDYDVQVFVTNEEVDKAVLVQNLISVLQTAAQLPQLEIDPVSVAEQIFDIMGLDTGDIRRKEAPLPAPQPQGQLPGAPAQQMAPVPSMAQMVQQANVPQV